VTAIFSTRDSSGLLDAFMNDRSWKWSSHHPIIGYRPKCHKSSVSVSHYKLWDNVLLKIIELTLDLIHKFKLQTFYFQKMRSKPHPTRTIPLFLPSHSLFHLIKIFWVYNKGKSRTVEVGTFLIIDKLILLVAKIINHSILFV